MDVNTGGLFMFIFLGFALEKLNMGGLSMFIFGVCFGEIEHGRILHVHFGGWLWRN